MVGTPLDILIPVLMSVALLWWVSRSLSWGAMLMAVAATLAVIVGVLLLQNAGMR